MRSVLDYRPGEIVGGYLRIEALLGQGGAAAVFRARDERSDQRVALKRLRVPSDEHRALLSTQFAREYHTLAQLAHPHIIEVYDYGVDRDSPYYTMELLDGEDLHECGRQPFRQACALLRDVASSLAVLHSRGFVHRDVSARNVRRTSGGGAKLLDFGAMAQMGTVQRAVGTPPFVPPEVLQMQTLDARVDLYGLGALAYWTLTGRHAYSATTFNQLRDAWRRPPRSIKAVAADVPDALIDLVLSLLRLDRGDRPRTAAEVMERLSGIAGLPLEEVPAVGRAYFVTPNLIGRDALLREVRRSLSHTLQAGHGASLMIEGAPGAGRSRVLDACVLEAKLMGATVLRADPGDAASGDYGVARALTLQLFETFPELCDQTAHPRAMLLAHVVPALASRLGPPAVQPQRRHLQTALRDFFLSLAREKHLVLAVDDVESIDEPSAALLGTLGHGAERRRLTLLLTTLAGQQTTAALGLLREVSQRLELGPLAPAQTEALLRAVFGDSPRVASLSDRVHARCHGNPRSTMLLAEQLASSGIVRYEAGTWSLPIALRDEDVSTADQEPNAKQLAALGADARELAEALALTDPRALSLAHYPGLTQHHDTRRTFAALDELVRAGLLVAEGDRYRLGGSDALAPLARALADVRRTTLHARIAGALPEDARSARRILHMLQGGRETDAIAVLLAEEPDALYPGRLEALVLAAETAERLHLATQIQLDLRYRVTRLAAVSSRIDLFDRYGWSLIERLRRDSGLADYHELDANLPKPERITKALERAQTRHQAAPSDERGFAPRESMLRLCALYGSGVSSATIAMDVARVERLGSLEPWPSLSTAIGLVERTVTTMRFVLKGQLDKAGRGRRQIMDDLSRAKDLDPRAASYMRLGSIYAMALEYAWLGDPACEPWIAELDSHPGHRGNAWRSRMIYELARGNLDDAQQCERRAELLDLQDAGFGVFNGSGPFLELFLHAVNDNIAGVKRVTGRVAQLAAELPTGWQPWLGFARAQHRRLQGDLTGALEALQLALDATAPGRHLVWDRLCELHVQLVLQLGRTEQAAALGRQYLAQSIEHDVSGAQVLKGAVAEALAANGSFEEAAAISEEQLADHKRAGIMGVCHGRALEARSRVAIAMRDPAGFHRAADRCAVEYLRGQSPGLCARYERLLREAAAAGLVVTTQPAEEAERAGANRDPDARTAFSRMLTCVSPAERAERALQLLLEATGARTGYFFGLRSSRLELLSNPDTEPPPPGLLHMLEECLLREFEGAARAAAPAASLVVTPAIARFIDALGREFEPLILAGSHDGELQVVGVAALHYAEDTRPAPRKAMLDAVIEALIVEDVVDPITYVN